MKPNCTALVSWPICAAPMPHARIRSSAALLAENQSEVPNNWAMTMTGTVWGRMREV